MNRRKQGPNLAITKTYHFMKSRVILLIGFYAVSISLVYSQTVNQDNDYKKHFIGSSLFVLANFLPEPPLFYQLDYGYRFTTKDAIIVEALTWKYSAPIGIPYGPSFESPDESYPGYVRAYGIGLGYQRYLYKGFFSAVQATPFLQQFYDLENKLIQNGFQLFIQLRLGHHFKLFKNRFYIEPAIAFNYWPINTNFPESFEEIESKWPNYFLFEPSLNFGVNF